MACIILKGATYSYLEQTSVGKTWKPLEMAEDGYLIGMFHGRNKQYSKLYLKKKKKAQKQA